MNDETVAAEARVHQRVREGMSRPHNWVQLVRFGAVGASGYVVNLAVFALLHEGADAQYQLAAVGAFLVALANNFTWNRVWTFQARGGHAGFQAARFFVVSLCAFGASLAVLTLLVEVVDLEEKLAQAIAIVCATPLNFLGNKLWSFKA